MPFFDVEKDEGGTPRSSVGKSVDNRFDKADVTQTSMNVTVIGSEKELKSLKSSDIEGVINTSDQSGTVGSVQMPVTFKLSGTDTCWVSGSYKANITISEK